ncbi:MAG: 16S rRNA (cytosine(1402)-N(4))-methyltransferase RsmH [bacterium]
MIYKHTSAMLEEVMGILNPKPGQKFIDCTLGGGGYSRAILEKAGESGKVLAVDLDELAIENAKLKLKTEIKNKKLILELGNFKNLRAIAGKHFADSDKFDGIVFDLGLSSAQLADRNRGFSFNLADSPLKMNFGGQISRTAEDIVNNCSAEDLAEIFRNYGEEKFAGRISSAIEIERKIGRIISAEKLAEIIVNAVPKRFCPSKIHPATKVFQALRIAVNQELENLREALPQAVDLLKAGGKLAIVSYHSLEDRIVKRYFKKESKDCLCPPESPICACGHKACLKILTHHILRPTGEEVLKNPRARSAKLRAAEKI